MASRRFWMDHRTLNRLRWSSYHVWHGLVHVGFERPMWNCHYCADRDGRNHPSLPGGGDGHRGGAGVTDGVRCVKCVEEGATSRVYAPMGGTTTLMGFSAYYDEQGVFHSHDPNWRGEEWSCSRGHRWHVGYTHRCPAGDYGGEERIAWFSEVAAVDNDVKSPAENA